MALATNLCRVFCYICSLKLVKESLEMSCSAGVSEFSESLCLDLSDTLSCDVEFLTYLFKSSGSSVVKSESELYNVLLTGSECMKLFFDNLAQNGG